MADGTGWPLSHGVKGSGPYTIQVQGVLAPHWEVELRLRLTHAYTELGPVTTLTGPLPDQAALLGALGRLAMWGYCILLVRYDGACGQLGLADREWEGAP